MREREWRERDRDRVISENREKFRDLIVN